MFLVRMTVLVSSGVSSASGRVLAYLEQNRAGLRPRRCGGPRHAAASRARRRDSRADRAQLARRRARRALPCAVGVRSAAPSSIRCGCCSPPAPPGCPKASCTGTAVSWSTSSRSPCSATSGPRPVPLAQHHRVDPLEPAGLPARAPRGGGVPTPGVRVRLQPGDQARLQPGHDQKAIHTGSGRSSEVRRSGSSAGWARTARTIRLRIVGDRR
jgi:hypothetical protein